MDGRERRARVSRLHSYVQTVCGIYSRIARRLGVDRSFVSRVAKGERHSSEVEAALLSELEQAERQL